MSQLTRRAILSRCLLALSFALLLTGPALASGGYGGGGGGRARDAGPSRTDPVYDLGKSVYQGQSKTARGLKICLAVPSGSEGGGGKVALLSSRTLHPFKAKALIDLTTRLVDCAVPSSQVATILDASEFRALVYYLNKRFQLHLES